MTSVKRIIFVLSFLSMSSIHAQKKQLKKLDFFIGEWLLETRDIQPDGSFKKGTAKSSVTYILDGYAIQDDYRVLDENKTIIFRGTSIRSFNVQTGKYQIVWMMPGLTGLTDITADFIDSRLVGKGKGYDENGSFIERFEYYNISKDRYSFKMDRSYDNGKNWINNFGTFEAKRIQEKK